MKNRFFPRFFFFLLLFFLLSFPTAQPFASTTESVILEVEGDANEHAAYIKKNYPLIDVVAVYDTLFQGLALQGKARELNKLGSLDFIKQVHGVQTYTTLHRPSELSPDQNVVYPESLNDTSYTGSGVKVGVIDTGDQVVDHVVGGGARSGSASSRLSHLALAGLEEPVSRCTRISSAVE